MVKEIRARFSQGKIEPLEEIDLVEGEEITITIRESVSSNKAKEALAKAAGAWKDTLDFDQYLRDLYDSRRQPSREIRL